MNFTKMQGAANDFVLIESDETQHDWPRLAIAMCDRHLGIGADSVLVVLPSDKADFRMRTFDADGSEAEACGNGIRCVARYLIEKGLIDRQARQTTIETAAGVRNINYFRHGGETSLIEASMGKPGFKTAEIPTTVKPGMDNVTSIEFMMCYTTSVNTTELKLNLISMGNPHAVHFQESPVTSFPLDILGPKVENMDIFPNRVNFEVARVLNNQQIEARVWERGVGETMACGSGACAIAAAAHLYGYTGRKVDIILRGGTLKVEWRENGELLLGGPAEIVFTGDWPN